MTRLITNAISQFEARKLVVPGFSRLRNVLERAARVDAVAITMFAEIQAIRGTSRGWMV